MSTARLASFEPSLGGPGAMEVAAEFAWRDAEPEPARPPAAAWETSSRLKEEEFARAVALGLFDYLRKSRVAGLRRQPQRRRRFLGRLLPGRRSWSPWPAMSWARSEFQRRLKHVPGLADDATHADRVRRLLHCVYQSSRNSGQATRHAAETAGARRCGRRCRASTSTDIVQRLCRPHRAAPRPPADVGDGRHCLAEHPGPRARPQRVAAGEREERPAVIHQQSQRSGGGLCHDGRRHLRRS